MAEWSIAARVTRREGWRATAGAMGGLCLLLAGCAYQTVDPGALAPDEPSLLRQAFIDVGGQFSQAFQCPVERVGVKIEPRVPNPPSPEVAADPLRLAIYTQQIQVELALTKAISAEGCGHMATFVCAGRDTRHHGERAVCVMTERGRLGVSIVRATRLIDRVEPGGLGERIGFRTGDVIVGLDRRPLVDMDDYMRVINDPGSPGHVVTVLRGGAPVDVAVPRLHD
jgi:PDZ domain